MRRTLTSVALALLVISVAASTACGQSWSSGATSGLTTVGWSLTGNTYTWTLSNNSGFDGDGTIGYDILIWSLTPFQVHEPTSWTAPVGWTWTNRGHDQSFGIARSDRKYESPSAIAPGESAVFTYTFSPLAPMVNSHGPQPPGIGFLTHVAAVRPTPVIKDGVKKWDPTTAPGLGHSWHDVALSYDPPADVPEPCGILILTLGSTWLVTCVARNRKRTTRYRGSLAME